MSIAADLRPIAIREVQPDEPRRDRGGKAQEAVETQLDTQRKRRHTDPFRQQTAISKNENENNQISQAADKSY